MDAVLGWGLGLVPREPPFEALPRAHGPSGACWCPASGALRRPLRARRSRGRRWTRASGCGHRLADSACRSPLRNPRCARGRLVVLPARPTEALAKGEELIRVAAALALWSTTVALSGDSLSSVVIQPTCYPVLPSTSGAVPYRHLRGSGLISDWIDVVGHGSCHRYVLARFRL